MTSEKEVEKKQKNFVLEKQSLQKDEGSNAKAGDVSLATAGARKKVKVKVRKATSSEKKDATEASSLSAMDSSKRKVTAVSKKKDEVSKENSTAVDVVNNDVTVPMSVQPQNDLSKHVANDGVKDEVKDKEGEVRARETEHIQIASNAQPVIPPQTSQSVQTDLLSKSVELSRSEEASVASSHSNKGVSVHNDEKVEEKQKTIDESRHEVKNIKDADGKSSTKFATHGEKRDHKRPGDSHQMPHNEKKGYTQNVSRTERKNDGFSATSLQKKESSV